MTIKELERQTGLPRTTIRFYEQEGLIAPERRENNYRDYSEEDAATLEKIKLLRKLSLEVGTISRLKAGELTLSQALREQAAVLEADRGDLERYAQVCLEMSRIEVDFGTLDPEPWLKELESWPLPPSRQVDLSRDSIAAAPYPWRRYFARGLDVGLCTCLWMAVRYLVLEWYAPDQVLDGALRSLADMYGGWLFLFLLEPILLAAWGYTPGKWIMGLRVRREDGRKLTWEEAGDRLVGVFFRGTGLGIPIYNIARLWDCYEKCAKDQVMSWDQGLSYTARPMKWGRGAVLAALCLLVTAAEFLVTDRSYLPPYPTEPLTAEQAVENYNWYERRRTELLGTTPRTSLNRDGSWAVQPSAYVSWSQWIELEKGAGEWSPVVWTVDQDGRVTGWSVTWDAAGNPYQTELEVLEPAMNILSPLLFALAPEAGEGSFLCQERFTQARRASLHMVLSILEDTRLQGAGTQGKVQGMGGVTLELEVLTARGYSRTSYSDGMTKLDQEDPGAGDLVIRFTASLTEG